jgi:hypothetical protein
MIATMRDRGVSISLGEGCIVRPGRDIRDMAGDFDIFQELGSERINTVSMDLDLGRSLDQFGVLAEMSAARGMKSSIELCRARSKVKSFRPTWRSAARAAATRISLGFAHPEVHLQTLSELAGCLAGRAAERIAEARGRREAERIGYGLDALAAGQQAPGMIELDVRHVRAYRAATTKTPRELAHRDMAWARKLVGRRDCPHFLESRVDQAQAPTGQAAAG